MTYVLWRCPLCATNDSTDHRKRFLKKDLVSCSACGAVWEVTRVFGKGFLLRVIAGPNAPIGLELPLAEWYDRMKAGIAFMPLSDGSLQLEEGESLYLKTDRVTLLARASNPIGLEGSGKAAPEGPLEDELLPRWRTLGPGRLYFTDHRLVWEGSEGRFDFDWRKVLSTFIFMLDMYGIMYGMTTYRFRIPGQSPLKWVTYSALHAERIEGQVGRRIATTHY